MTTIGGTLGRYQILEQLGEGGMGVVFRAHDPRLDREVALKVLTEEALRDERARERLRQEARALSRLLHPNIATLFDIDSEGGEDFLVLEFVPGVTLAKTLEDGPLPEARARVIAHEIADALDVAHEQGVVHRDLKPGNVIITPRGRAKVLDFGIARLLTGGVSANTTQSGAVSLSGTAPYMAPEQIQGRTVDARTDLYSLGVVLFEMISGSRPFEGDELISLIYRIVHDPPRRLSDARPGVSPDLEVLVARCLEKEPSRRFANVRAFAAALKELAGAPGALSAWVAGVATAAAVTPAGQPRGPGEGPAPVTVTRTGEPSRAGSDGGPPRIRSLVVLPLANRSGDPAQDFFTDGMTDALIADLAQIRALRVISRTSAMRYRGSSLPLPEIARELQVEAVVEGSVMRAGERVRITAQLIEAATDRTLWAKSYERDITDILALQSDVARAIADGIRIQVTPEEALRLRPKGPVNPAAHVAYLQGRYLWNRWSPESLRASITHFEEALAADPNYALAYAGLADSFSTLGNIGSTPPSEAYPRAREAAERGLGLDDSLAELHASLAYVHRFYDWDWPRAEREFLRAIDLNPGYATAHRWYAQFLSGLARHDEAIVEAERALELDPLSLIIHTAVGDVLFYSRRYDRAIVYYRRCIELDPAFGPGHTDLARALDAVGRHDEALEELITGTEGQTRQRAPSTGLATLLLRAGRKQEGRAMIDELQAQSATRFVSSYGIASFYAAANENAAALDWLERAYGQRDGTLVWIKVHPRLDGLRAEPRFRELLRKMRLDS
jgi:TolB-like protein/Tfp pilus assembly protein PilF/predicted Ser/Thr protein kinase